MAFWRKIWFFNHTISLKKALTTSAPKFHLETIFPFLKASWNAFVVLLGVPTPIACSPSSWPNTSWAGTTMCQAKSRNLGATENMYSCSWLILPFQTFLALDLLRKIPNFAQGSTPYSLFVSYPRVSPTWKGLCFLLLLTLIEKPQAKRFGGIGNQTKYLSSVWKTSPLSSVF